MPNSSPNFPQAPYGKLIDVSDVLELRRSVFPLVFSNLDGTFLYHGTSFSVTYEGGFCTAMHVIKDGFGSSKSAEMRDKGAYALIYLPGVAYGAPIVRPFRRLLSGIIFPRDPNPLAYRTTRDADDIGYDVARVRFEMEAGDQPFPLWVRTGFSPMLKEGRDVIAVGFNEAKGTISSDGAPLHYRDVLSATRLKVTKLEFREPGALGGGPIMTLNENIPGGFSGGPIFTEDGAVVGLVSTGTKDARYGTGVWLEPYGVRVGSYPDIFPEQAHDSEDLFEAWGVIDQGGDEPRSLYWAKGDADIKVPPAVRVQRVWRDRAATGWIKAPARPASA